MKINSLLEHVPTNNKLKLTEWVGDTSRFLIEPTFISGFSLIMIRYREFVLLHKIIHIKIGINTYDNNE